jgi:CheY-like chemotaxis protein
MLALPCISFIVNSGSFNSMVAELMHSHSSSVAIVYYRSMRRQVKAIFWEISIVENHYISRGVDITSLLHATKANETASTDKMLRQWLHSIRNASFHQQAEVLQEDIADIKGLVGDISPDLADRFKKVEEGLRTLVYTAKATVGLIDQAMETKMDKCTSVGDFVASAKAFGKRFMAREGNFFSDTLNVFELYVDGKLSPMSALGGIYVKGDMHDLKSLIDELYSNAVRYTAPNLGLKVQFHIHVLDSSIQFMVDIEDYAPDGLPDELVSFYELHLAPSKLMRIRPSSASQNQPSPDYVSSACPSCDVLSKKSSRSGIPRVVSIFYSLTANGDIDLDIRILMRPAGTIHSINFCMPILAPKTIDPIVRFDTDDPRVVLVVDDSHVVRRIVGKYLQKLNVPFHSCVDGVEALEWFMEHMDNCFGVLTDLEMPRMGGNALIDRLKQICPSMPCMIVSGNNIAVESCPPGALRAILKPITLEQIQGAVLELKSHNGAIIVT